MKKPYIIGILLLICFFSVLCPSVCALETKLPPASPIPLSPGTSSEPGEQINTLTPTLTWTEVFTWGTPQENFQAHTEEYYYAIEIRKYPYDSNNIVYKTDMISYWLPNEPGIIVPMRKLVPGEKYRWNVKAHNIAGWSSFSSPLYFRTEPVTTITSVSTTVLPTTTPTP